MRVPDVFLKKGNVYFLLGSVFFCIFMSFQFLPLAFYWDEAWSYMNSIFQISDKLSLLFPHPDIASTTKGHPPLFYGLGAVWVKLFGESPTIVHVLPLMISLLTLISVYRVSIVLFSGNSARLAVVLLVVQPIFVAQANLMLPEMLLAMLALHTIASVIEKKYLQAAIWGTLAVLTKESGLVVVLTVLLWETISAYRSSGVFFSKTHRKQLILLLIPIFIFIMHIGLYKIVKGWFFYPSHMSFVEFSWHGIKKKFASNAMFIFWQHGRYVLTLMILAASIFRFKSLKQYKRHIFLVLLFIVFYLVFLSLNFNTTRYNLSALLPYIILSSGMITLLFQNTKWQNHVMLVLVPFFIFQLFTSSSSSDSSFGHKNMVQVHEAAVGYIQENIAKDEVIQTHFLMYHYLSNPRLGYLERDYTPNNAYQNFVWKLKKEPDVVVISSIESSKKLIKKIRKNVDYKIVIRFSNAGCWSEIYRRK